VSGSVHPSDEELWADEPSAGRHVAECETCREAQRSARRRQQDVTDVLAAATPVATTMPVTVQRRLAAALDAATLDAPTPSRRRSVLAGLAAAAALVVLAAVGIGQTSDPVADGGGGEQTREGVAEAGQAPAEAALSGTADSDAASAPPPIPPALVDAAQRTAAQRTDAERIGAATTCGARLLDGPDDAVVAVDEVMTDPRGGVLVTVDDGAGRVLWWLPSCTAGPGGAWGRSLLQ
jgi:hypothetical protein